MSIKYTTNNHIGALNAAGKNAGYSLATLSLSPKTFPPISSTIHNPMIAKLKLLKKLLFILYFFFTS